MEYLDLTFTTPAENLACDEALLDLAESGQIGELLRVWEPQTYFVVVGYSNQVSREVNLAACNARAIPVYRRCSGGGAVVLGPGCLNYTLILQLNARMLRTVTDTNRFVMERNCAAISALLREMNPQDAPLTVGVRGATDLVVGDKKFSGNAQRRRKQYALFHGTFLLNFDIGLVEELLFMPSRQPFYRQNRAHVEFMTNLNLPSETVKGALRTAWAAAVELKYPPTERVCALVVEKYGTESWNFKF